jgi:hypothetical protein
MPELFSDSTPAAGLPDPPPQAAQDGLRAGWALAVTWAETAVPRAIRKKIQARASVIGGLVSLGAAALFVAVGADTPPDGFSPWAAAVLSICSGVAVGSVFAYIAFIRVKDGKKPETPPLRRVRPAMLKDTTDAAIRRAWLDGVEPTVDIGQRLAAAERARATRLAMPRYVVSILCLAPFLFAGAVASIVVVISGGRAVGFIALPLWAVTAIGGLTSGLRALGRPGRPSRRSRTCRTTSTPVVARRHSPARCSEPITPTTTARDDCRKNRNA